MLKSFGLLEEKRQRSFVLVWTNELYLKLKRYIEFAASGAY